MRLRALALFALASPLVPHLAGQSVISTRAGLINFSEGLVFVDGHPVSRKFGTYERLKNGSTLVTQSGRAEVLLTPNTYLRIGEDSSIKMVSDNLSDTQVEILAGSAALDSEAASTGSFVKLIFKDATVRILKPGRYRVDAEPPQLRVYDGQAEVSSRDASRNGKPTTVEESQLMPLDGAPVVKRFTEGTDGLLDIWSDERHSMIASNLLNSQSLSDPLTDPGVDPSDYLASLDPYAGYIPLAGLPTMAGYYGYSPYGYNPYGLYGYNPYGTALYAYSYLQPFGLIVRPNYSRVRSVYTQRTGLTPTFGVRPPTTGITISRPTIFTPRPVSSGARVGGVRVGGRR